jgi:hypothetical protein
MLNYLHFKKLYSRQQNLDTVFLINVFKNKIDCCSIGLRVPTKQIRDFSTYNVSNVRRFSRSTTYVATANGMYRSLDFFNKPNISIEDTFSFALS